MDRQLKAHADITARTVEVMPITPEDFPGYAVRLYEAGAVSLEVNRFVAWYQLQHGADANPRTSVKETSREKIAKVTAAPDAGIISSLLSAAELVLTVQTIARMWAT